MFRAFRTLVCVFTIGWAAAGWAQLANPGFGGPASDGAPSDVQITAKFYQPTPDRRTVLAISADVADGYHIYSITQKRGGPTPTKIKLDPSQQFKVVGEFQATKPPKVHFEKDIWPDLPLEEHYGVITWVAPIELADGVNPRDLVIKGLVDLQVCDPGKCVPEKLPFQAVAAKPGEVAPKPDTAAKPPAMAPADDAGASKGEYRAKNSAALVQGRLEPASAEPGSTVNLILSVAPDPGFHTYPVAKRDPLLVGAGKPTLIVESETPGIFKWGAPTTTSKVLSEPSTLNPGTLASHHEGPVTWSVPITIPADATPGDYPIKGIIGYHVCLDTSCQTPEGARFSASLTVSDHPSGAAAPLYFSPAKYAEAALLAAQRNPAPTPAPVVEAFDLDKVKAADDKQYSLGYILGIGFLGGLILNLMPCVLPVIGLKVMSFVEQAGHSRREALMLNIWYSLGLISVFMTFALLAVLAGASWGATQFSSAPFNIVLAGVVFAMALSMLGVWEIPIPGFIGGSDAMELAEKEGPSGAFIKGVLTTILATPCIGPGMSTALFWAVQQPAVVTLLVFFCIGLGMALPYLVIGAYPQLIKFIPKPGAWMETFKQIMGFVLLATVVFLLYVIASLDPALVIPTITLMIGIAVACWWISRTPMTADLSKRLISWATASVMAAVLGVIGFTFIYDETKSTYERRVLSEADRHVVEYVKQLAQSSEVDATADKPTTSDPTTGWPAFSLAKLAELTGKQQTVLVDFSADWCVSCKALERGVLHTDVIEKAIEANGVATLYADYTAYPPEIKHMLDKLGSVGVPVIAIFPAGRPNAPFVFRGLYTKGDLLDALEKAGPSKPITNTARRPSDNKVSASPTQPAVARAGN